MDITGNNKCIWGNCICSPYDPFIRTGSFAGRLYTTARSKGSSERSILTRHILPNSMIPVVTALGASFGMQMAGTIVIENLFSIPGIGQYTVSAISSRDYYAVQGSVIVLAIVFSLIMLIVDVIYAYIDPRIKAQFEGGVKTKRRVANAENKI